MFYSCEVSLYYVIKIQYYLLLLKSKCTSGALIKAAGFLGISQYLTFGRCKAMAKQVLLCVANLEDLDKSIDPDFFKSKVEETIGNISNIIGSGFYFILVY